MAINRELWQSHLTRFHAPRWLCPRCGKGHLVLKPESVFFLPSGAAYAQLEEDPEVRGNDLELRFSALLQCDFKACEETASVAGVGEEKSTHASGHRELYVVLFPRFISPSPELFPIPPATPEHLASVIKSAFILSWGNYEACLNGVRLCLEILLDFMRIPRSTTKAGKRNPLTLHRRVELAQANVPATKPYLMAVKHLGNAGSHTSGLDRNDVFDCFDLLDAVVTGLYSEQKRVVSLAGKIVKKRGPLKRKAGQSDE